MFRKILVANRSEIACRVIRACKELDIKTVAVFSEADRNSLHVLMADESICIGPPPALQSYLNIDAIINATLETKCDAIHPGYGFLSEKYDFNKKVNEAGLVFIGSKPEPMKLLGSKVESRKTMIDAGIPVIPGMKGSSKNLDDYIKLADEIGYPVLIKASDGGGGKGMRVVNNPEELKPSVESAMRESQSAFGSDIVFLEKYIESPRHVEIQIAADNYGNAVYLFERECSIQRRHQKIIEETPSVALNPELRKKMGETAVKVIKAANYNNLGTVEFLLDKNNNFYFLEVNTRIQVEHPVTEMTTGVDLVKLQLKIAAGEELPFRQEDLRQNGHSIECRIYAEDADNNFMPSAGKILFLKEPVGPGVRYDCGIYEGFEVPIYYDPILAKLIVWGKNREEARKRMILALKDNVILGVQTSIRFMLDVLEHPEFIAGNTFTNFIDINMKDRINHSMNDLDSILAAGAYAVFNEKPQNVSKVTSEMPTPWQTIGKWEIANSSKRIS